MMGAMKIIRKLKFKLTKRRIIVLVVLLAVGGFFFYRSQQAKNKDIETATVARGLVEEQLVLSGELKATNDTSLQFNTSGKLAWVKVKEGDVVKAGQALMQLDTKELNSIYQRAASDLRSADASVAKVHDDLKDKGNSETYAEKETRTTAEVAKDKAYEAYLIAKNNLESATLKAPFAGVVTYLAHASPGMNISLASVQAKIVDPTTIYLSVSADQTEVSSFAVGDRASIIFDAFEETPVEGTITSISFSPSEEESGTVYPINIALASNTDYSYRVGMTADAKFILKKKENVLYVPAKYVKNDKKGKYVMVANNKKEYVTVGIEGEDRIEIEGNIHEGDIVFD